MSARHWRVAGVLATLLVTLLAPSSLAAAQAAGPRVAIILMDANISPPPGRLAAERAEALAYARALSPDVRVGLIVFAGAWRQALAPTTNRSLLAAAVAGVRSTGATSDGIRAALRFAAREISRTAASTSRLVVLSDAESLTGPVAAVSVRIDAALWHSDDDDSVGVLRQLVARTGGYVVAPARVAALAAAFPSLPSPAHRPVASPSRRPGNGAPSPVRTGSAAGFTNSLGLVVVLVFAALLVLSLLALGSLRPGERRSRLATRIARYGPTASAESPPAAAARPGKMASAALGFTKAMLSARNAEPKLARRLDQAGMTRAPAEWALLGVCLSVVLAAGLSVLLRNVAIGLVLGALAGWAIMRLMLSSRISRRRAAFDEQLPNVLQLIAGSIQSGFSLAQSMDAVVREDAQPASGEFARALAENRLGVDLPDALDSVADRLQSSDLRWVIMAIRIQRETGGNLAEVLRNTVATMRERGYLRRQVRSLSAEGRLSAYILLALPPLIGGWMLYSDPAYMRPLYGTFYGLVLLTLAVAGVGIGTFWMRQLIKVEV